MINRDQIQIIKHLNAFRIWNLIKLKFSFLKAKYFKSSKIYGMPYAASIEPTTACNLGCPECPSGLKSFTRPTGKMDYASHQTILNSLGKQLFYINYYFQGEPFINQNILDFIKAAKSKHIYTSTSTNAHFITAELAINIVKSGLDRLIISIDGATQETYEKYRINGQLDKVINGTKELVKAKKKLKSKTPHLIFQFLVNKENEHEINEIIKLSDECEVNEIRLKTIQVYDFENGNNLIPTNQKYSRYQKRKDGTYQLKNKFLNECWRMWSSTVSTWDGSIVPCCFDKDAKHIFGQITANYSFKEIWFSKTYNQFRTSVFHNRNQIEICKNCSEGTKVWT
jgi:radical SAM protein with 4Fe4S-binding SPASM domain